MMQHHTKSGYKRFNSSEYNVQMHSQWNVQLSQWPWRTQQSNPFTIHPSSYDVTANEVWLRKRISSPLDTVGTTIFWLQQPSLWGWSWRDQTMWPWSWRDQTMWPWSWRDQTNLFSWHSGYGWCTTTPSLAIKDWWVQRISSKHTHTHQHSNSEMLPKLRCGGYEYNLQVKALPRRTVAPPDGYTKDGTHFAKDIMWCIEGRVRIKIHTEEQHLNPQNQSKTNGTRVTWPLY